MFSQEFYCKNPACLPDYTTTLEGLAIAKLLKVLVQIKANKPSDSSRATEIKSVLNHLYSFTQKVYKFTGVVKCKLQFEQESCYYRVEVIDMNLPSIIRYIELNDTVEIYFTNLTKNSYLFTFFDRKASEYCEKHEISYSEEQYRDILSLPTFTYVHYNVVKYSKK